MKRLKSHPRSGQAMVEYVLMILVALSVVSALSLGFRKVLFRVWMQIACDVTAPCPHCAAPAPVKTSANRVSPGSCR